MWNLERPNKPALPNSYFWTWDHSTNWVLDDPGLQNFGCANKYLKRLETFVEDYRRLTDAAAGLGVKGILIWGFLRDSHGGVEYSKRVADYAASKGVAIMPGIGTTWYGGVYYEGDHPYNLETFLQKNPDARMIDEKGEPQEHGACPTHPAYVDWLAEGLQWLFREFEIGGANLENGDFVVCYEPRCTAHKAEWPPDDPDFFRFQALSYVPALEAVAGQLKDKLVTYATYTGFVPGSDPEGKSQRFMSCRRPAMFDRLRPDAVCQWTITEMVRSDQLPLKAFLDEGAPAEVFDNPRWPNDIRPPSTRSVGFLHQASQWNRIGRYQLAVSTIKEGCLRAYRAGLEGVSIHGEVTPHHIPSALNYLAFSHFIHWPEDSLRGFGRKTMAQVLGSEDEGEAFVQLLAAWDEGTLTDDQRKELRDRCWGGKWGLQSVEDLERSRFWHWLHAVAAGRLEKHTVSWF
ncbi:MAG: hypothetical protein ACP5R5_14905 [Armatimonadota bacterium]